MSDDVIATQVTVDVLLHKSIKFCNENAENMSNNDSKMHKVVGNATPSSSFSFQYLPRTDEELEALGINKNELRSIPLQAIFTYRTTDGKKCIRAITKIVPVAFSKDQAEDAADVEIMARCARRNAVKLVEEGKLEEAKENTKMWNEMLREEAKGDEKIEVLQEFERDAEELANNIDKHLEKEEKLGVKAEGLQDEDKAKRRKDYGDDLIVGMSKLKKKK
jgi:predicted transposase YbfD/YdcC